MTSDWRDTVFARLTQSLKAYCGMVASALGSLTSPSSVHPWQTPTPSWETLSGMESVLSFAHPAKADVPILVRLGGRVRLTMSEQFVNVLSLITVIFSERVTAVSAEQPASEALPSSDTLDGRITAESFEQFSKADAPTISKELAVAKLSVERLEHPLKASGAICLMFEGMVTAVMAEQSLKAPARRTDTDGSSRIATATRLAAVTP